MHTNFQINHRLRRERSVERFHGLRRLFVSFICVICAICGFNCFFIAPRVTSLYLFADELRPSPAWEVNTEDARLARTALKIAKESYPEIDIEYYLEKIENIVENIKTTLRDETEP
ncbi:MAG: hypothetical protein FJ266_08225, partial [Planctomycetes bacterium]|nr:hypothetical protein [Planctomycetota bacterium]